MISTIGRYEFSIDAYLTDFRGKATLPMIGGFMLQAATKHAQERNFGYEAMKSKERAWVLSRMVIEIDEYPKNDRIFVIKTWIADVNKLFSERYFSFEDENGAKLGYAKSIWASIDLSTRCLAKVLNVDELSGCIEKGESCPIDGVGKIHPIKCHQPLDSFVVKYSDIDINKHLNSMKYIQYFVDIFDIDMFREKEIHRFQINYVNEAHYGTNIDIFRNKEEENEIYTLEMKHNDTTVCMSHISWK